MKSLLIGLGVAVGSLLNAQGLVGGFSTGKNNLNVVPFFSYESYNEFYRGSDLVDLPPMLDQINVISTGIYGEYGATDKLDIITNASFISAVKTSELEEAPEDQSGLQDINVAARYKFLSKSKFDLFGFAGLGTPLSNYVADAPVSIGNRATSGDLRVIGQYKISGKFFVNGQVGYMIKTDENDWVPNAMVSGTKVGYTGSKLYAEAWFQHVSSADGTDIGSGDPFPTNKIDFTRIGGAFVVPFSSKFLIAFAGSYILDGRNVGKAWAASSALIFKLNTSKKTTKTKTE